MRTALSVIAIALSVISGGFTLYTFFWTTARDRKQATLEAYNRLQKEVFDNLNQYRPSQIQEIVVDNRSAEYKILSGYLARIEHFCVGINQNIYDRKIFYILAHGYFDGPQVKNRIEILIHNKNQKSTSLEMFYDDILKVWEWMEEKSAKK